MKAKRTMALHRGLVGGGGIGLIVLMMLAFRPSGGSSEATVLDAWLPGAGDSSYEGGMLAGVMAGPTSELRLGKRHGHRGRDSILASGRAKTSSLAESADMTSRVGSREIRQQVRNLDNEAKLLRTKAHLQRLQAGDDLSAASGELERAARAESSRGSISRSAAVAKNGLAEFATDIKGDGAAAVKLRAKATKIQAQVAKLTKEATAYSKLALADGHSSAEIKNKADEERKAVSRDLVVVAWDRKETEAIKRSLTKTSASLLALQKRGQKRMALAAVQARSAEARAKAAAAAFKALTSFNKPV